MRRQISRLSPHRKASRPCGSFWLLAPVLYAVMGYVLTGVVSFVYNAIARRIGGIEDTVTDVPD